MSQALPTIDLSFSLRYGNNLPAALDLQLQIPGRGVTAIFGPSGAGKTSLLRCIAGLERAQGELSVMGQSWLSHRHSLATHKRPLGYVFQEASLFAHLTAAGNLRFAQKRAATQLSNWNDIVSLMGLADLLERYPHQLSGGERQRVAIARALLIQPQLLLMDEPLAALDASLKHEIMPYLERLHERAEMPILYVSHSLDEIARLADYVVVLQQGRVQLQGSVGDILPQIQTTPSDEVSVLIKAKLTQRDEQWHLAGLDFSGGVLWVPDTGKPLGQSQRVRILARDVSISRDQQVRSSILNRLPAQLLSIQQAPDSAQALLHLNLGGALILARVTRRSVAELELAVGDNVWAQIKSVAVIR